MLLLTLLSSLCLLTGASPTAPLAIDTFANITIYNPNDGTRPWYARTETLANGTILATWSSASAVYRSNNNAFSWYPVGTIESNVEGRSLVQPHLLLLNETIGDYDAGTVLLAVNAWDNSSTNIELYGSQDSGETWEFLSTVATGGAANTTNGATPVWEPFLMVHNGKLICYYSDQRDKAHGQKLSHQTSTDLSEWGAVVNDVAEATYTDRPGMTTIAKLPNGKFILTFEYAMLRNPTDNGTSNYTYPVHFRIADDPEKFDLEKSQRIIVSSGTQPDSAPYVIWSPVGGVNGTIIVSDADHNSVFINQALGEGNWTEVKTPAARSYSRELKIPENDVNKLRITGGAEYGQQSSAQVLTTVMDFEKAVNLSK
ncbi:hypothetical protein GQ43DRAFT_441428 [Delitschia confertaspora ATCC 74209]|uniref:BNR/Asp-box repeat protein n=1 Tax=Delitschia confertaspora ATCC 74209 TaxID=1513339 RepID=A0A9P4JK28_9PLEO|nr:hypothetical protein GQ43DRAFT_441428 [Delitschia confertaspora ATCC 74209]